MRFGAALLMLTLSGLVSANRFAYVTNNASTGAEQSVQPGLGIIDLTYRSTVPFIVLPGNSDTVAVSADGLTLYAAGREFGRVYVVDLETAKYTTTINYGTGASPVGVDISPDGSLLYVSHVGGFSAINTATRVAITAAPGTALTYSGNGVRFLPGLPYAVFTGSDGLSIVWTGDHTVKAEVASLPGARGTAVYPDPDLAVVYVANQNEDSIAAVVLSNTATPDLLSAGASKVYLEAGCAPRDLTVSADGAYLYVVCEGDLAETSTVNGQLAILSLASPGVPVLDHYMDLNDEGGGTYFNANGMHPSAITTADNGRVYVLKNIWGAADTNNNGFWLSTLEQSGAQLTEIDRVYTGWAGIKTTLIFDDFVGPECELCKKGYQPETRVEIKRPAAWSPPGLLLLLASLLAFRLWRRAQPQ